MYSPGSPLFLPNGARIFIKLTDFLRAQYIQFGFEEVITPTIYKNSLWEKSGHWDNYADDMYSVTGRGASGKEAGCQIGEDEEYGLKPMNCPGHCLLFGTKQRSYKEMPIRYAEFSPLHRNERSGALSGLTRVRRFHQDDAHIFCRPSQVGEEISKTLDFVRIAYETFRLGPYKLVLSTRPNDHFIGKAEEWDRAEDGLRKALDQSGQEWTVNEGDGAFYGPKIDIILKDADGKEHQTATIQLDFQLPKRFELTYLAPAPELEDKGLTTTDPELLSTSGLVTPVIIHRAILGSVERFMALLIEHYKDAPSVVEYAQSIKSKFTPKRLLPKHLWENEKSPQLTARELYQSDIRVEIDDSSRSLGKKIVEAKQKCYNVIIVVGKQNVESQTVDIQFNVDRHEEMAFLKSIWGKEDGGRPGQMSVESVVPFLLEAEQRFF